MKRPLKAREVAFVLIPALGLGGFAWYQKRVESVGGPRRSDGLFVARVEMKPAKGRFQAMGLSHEMKVTIAHSWPRPSWWGNWHSQSGINPLQSAPQNQTMRGMTGEQMLSYGAVLTTTSMSNGKPVIKTQWRDNRIGVPMIDNQLVFSHEMALEKISASAGEVTFHGLYLIGAQKPLRITRVLRKAGETIPFKPDHSPHGRIVSITAKAFQKTTSLPANITEDGSEVQFMASRTLPGKRNPRVQVDDLKLHDARGQVLKPYATLGFHFSWSNSSSSAPNTTEQIINLYLAPTLKTTNPLTLRGKISIDEGWPIPFSVRLPSR